MNQIKVNGTTYPIHPVAMTFPDHDPETYAQLLHSVKTRGFMKGCEVLTFGPNGTSPAPVMDGRHRLMACAELGVEPVTQRLEDLGCETEMEALDFVMTKCKTERMSRQDAEIHDRD